MDTFLSRIGQYSPLVLRVGIGMAILWFGLHELINPDSWVSWVPTWATHLGVSKITIIYLNGGFETVASILLIFGVWVRPVAFLMFLHMALIVNDIGLDDAIGIRDSAIALALLAIATQNRDDFAMKL